VKIGKIARMEKVEIKKIADYIQELEEDLYELGYRGQTTQIHLNRLYQIIKRLMGATFITKDKQLKVLLATLEYKARKCKECIESRLAMKN
jgi:hypothetical protein